MDKLYHYLECGLPNVWLQGGVRRVKTRSGPGVAIHDVDGLHRAIGTILLNKPRLTGAEVRFLRKEIGLSQRRLGEALGVTEQAVAKWEKTGRTPKPAERLLRLIYAEHATGNVVVHELIERINALDNKVGERVVMKSFVDGWRPPLAA